MQIQVGKKYRTRSGDIASIIASYPGYGEPEDYRYEMTEKHPDFVPATLPVPVVALKYNGDTRRLVIEFASEKDKGDDDHLK